MVREYQGCNDHPTSVAFLTAVECLSFYNLAKSPSTGSVAPSQLNALLLPTDVPARRHEQSLADKVDSLLNIGKLSEAKNCLESFPSLLDHGHYGEVKSDSRLVYYVAGYVVRRLAVSNKCSDCASLLLSKDMGATPCSASLVQECDMGSLLYPSVAFFEYISALEDIVTHCFSISQLHRESMSDIIDYLHGKCIPSVGCEVH